MDIIFEIDDTESCNVTTSRDINQRSKSQTSRLSSTSSIFYSPKSSGYNTDEMYSAENVESFEGDDKNQTMTKNGRGQNKSGLRRINSTPNNFGREKDEDENSLSNFEKLRLNTYDLPDVFDEEEEFDDFDPNCSPRDSPRSRRDSGIGELKNRQLSGKARQRYNSSSIRRTPASPGYVSELIERRGSLKSVPAGKEKDNHCIRSALKFIRDPLNVLVLGPHDSGKTTLINSLLMSVTGEWSDRAQYGTGRTHNLAPVVLYENPEHHKRCRTISDNSGRYHPRHQHFDPNWKRGHDDPCGRVVMWDTRGFHNIHDEHHQALLLRYILEGRLHPQNLSQALLLPDEVCKKRYKTVIKDNQIDLILYVAPADEEPNIKLFKAIIRAKEESKDEKSKKVPVFLAMTKFDLLSQPDQEMLEQNIFYYHPESYGFFGEKFSADYSLINDDVIWRRIRCYESRINPIEDEVVPNTPDSARDVELLKLFKDVINYSLTPNGKRRCSSSSSKFLNLARNTGHKLMLKGRSRTISI